PALTMITLISELLNIIFTLVGLAGNTVVLWLLGFCMCMNVVSVYILSLEELTFSSHCCPKHMSAVICALLWALSLLLSILLHIYYYFSFKSSCYPCPTVSFISVAWLILLFVVLCGCSLALLVSMLCASMRSRLTSLHVTIRLTVLLFLLCGLPVGILVSLLLWFINTRDFIC
ncbi:mas-related G-protein coupled receptor member X2-like, partial [Fukomys damarensis]|uniref:mas-related G-protein coupled receptor member X2-like n=1 Tax=Fukomys damarensis TaxID=885580 RepID=UPI0014554789